MEMLAIIKKHARVWLKDACVLVVIGLPLEHEGSGYEQVARDHDCAEGEPQG
jgi:hypothetical protein